MSATVATIAAAFKQVARCSACRLPPESISTVADVRGGLSVVARCHGSTERVVVEEWDFITQAFGHVAGKLRDLFATDAYPDMQELIRYNRNPWVLR